MLERIEDGVNGLHFRAADPRSLADTIQRAISSPELWDQIRGQITDPYSMEKHLEMMVPLYRQLLELRTLSAAA
jgi:glycosyltransferase involved in cell wall biosynthesis